MSNTLILRSAKSLLSPLPGTPVVPDIFSNIYWELDPVSLAALAPGAAVDAWVASGVAPSLNRTYNFQYSNWGKPTYSPAGGPNGAPAVLFSGSQQICNGAGTTAQVEPLTYAVVCKSSAFANTQSRIFSDTNHWVLPSPSGYSMSDTGAPAAIPSNNPTTDWVVVIAKFDGEHSVFKVGTGPQIPAPLMAVKTSGRNVFGGNPTTLTGIGLEGGIAFARAYTRSLNASDIDALALSLSRRFGLTT
ncbi:hypothetical protein [Pseudomonas sp. UMAB-40]|uniref:hypothetical protein n=1 Tax=Pseudomonas sp. UMAB-40 TaxID=1365407 RepID=UPI001C57A0A0|nr:hypothetical protein [Pseudomonas sp. UMAB-40]